MQNIAGIEKLRWEEPGLTGAVNRGVANMLGNHLLTSPAAANQVEQKGKPLTKTPE